MNIPTSIKLIKKTTLSADTDEKTVFNEIHEYFQKYTKPPTVEALLINLDNNTSLNENVVKGSKTIVDAIGKSNEPTPSEWLENETEQWCKDRAIYIAVMDSIEVIDKKSQRSTGEIPELLKDALSVSFDTNIGHDQIEDSDARFEFYAMVKRGMSNAHALRTATVNAADLIGVHDRGEIKEGMLADIIAVDGNPLEDIRLMENVSFVMKGGEIFR